MNSPGQTILEWTGRAAYFFAFMLIVVPLASAGARLWPADPAELSWRLDVEALLSGYLLTFLSGFLLANGLAVGQRRHTLVRVLAIVDGFFGIVMIGLLVDMTMNALQLRRNVTDDKLPPFYATTAVSLLEFLLAGVLLLWLCSAGLRAARRFKEQAPGGEGEGTAQPLASIWNG